MFRSIGFRDLYQMDSAQNIFWWIATLGASIPHSMKGLNLMGGILAECGVHFYFSVTNPGYFWTRYGY
jgi:hypothetical protein